MALLFWDGFDTYNSTTDMTNLYPSNYFTNWDNGGGNARAAYSPTGGRFGGVGIYSYLDSCWCKVQFPTTNEIYTGRAILTYGPSTYLMCVWNPIPGYNSQTCPDVWLEIYQGTVRALNFQNNATWGNSIGQGGTCFIGNSAPNIWKTNAWNWLEMRCKISSSNTTADGIVQVWLNNQLIISNTSCVTNRVNQAGYNGVNLVFGGYNSGVIDDIYVLDTTGPAPWNTRLGDLRIATIVPNADVGANSGTPSTGTTHWGVVDERPYNTSDYITIPNVPGNTEKFAHTPIPANANVLSVGVTYVAVKSDAGTVNARMVLVNNVSGYMANSTMNLSTSWTMSRSDFPTNPETGVAWTSANVSNTLLGIVIDP